MKTVSDEYTDHIRLTLEVRYTYHINDDRPHNYRIGNYIGTGRSRAEAKIDLQNKIQNAGMVEA